MSPFLLGGMQNLSEFRVTFSIGGKSIGVITSSLEALEVSPHIIPKRILNKICNTANSVEISFSIEEGQNNIIGGNLKCQ